jgi:clan AA aspartic protease (TIGR02281 family)
MKATTTMAAQMRLPIPVAAGLPRWKAGMCLLALAVLLMSQAPAVAGPLEDGVNFLQAGHYRWALEKFLEAVDRAPKDAERRRYLAETYEHLGEFPAAIHEYRYILQIAPQSPAAAAARRALSAMGEPTLARIQVPFQRAGNSVLLPARVNGRDVGAFILDTGASFTSLSAAAAASLGVTSSGGTVRLITANGSIQAPLALLDEVEVGGAVARQVPAVIHDLPNLPHTIVGLLGLSFLERFRVSLDVSGGVLTLEAGE